MVRVFPVHIIRTLWRIMRTNSPLPSPLNLYIQCVFCAHMHAKNKKQKKNKKNVKMPREMTFVE